MFGLPMLPTYRIILRSGGKVDRITVKNIIETVQQGDGRIVIENGEHKGKAGDGRFLKRGTCVNI